MGARARLPHTKHSPVFAIDYQAWMDDGLCTQGDANLWHGETPEEVFEARRICRSCPVMLECLQFALDREQTGGSFGVWGGHTAQQRREILKGRRVRSAA